MNNHFHIRTTLTICTFGYALGQVFFLLAHDRTALILARAFAGVFTGGCFTSFFAYIVHHTNDETRAQALTFYATSQVIAGALGFFIGGRLGELGVKVSIWAQIVGESLVAVMFFLSCKKDDPAEKAKAKISEIIKKANPFAAFYSGREFLNRNWVILLFVCMLEYLGYVGFDQSLNYYLKAQFDFTPSVNGNLKLVICFATFIANVTICRWLMKKTQICKSVIVNLFLLSVTMAAFCCLNTAFLPLAAIAVLFFALDCITVPLLQKMVSEEIIKTGGDNNLIMGFYNSLRFFGAIFGGLSSGYLYDISPKAPFIMAGVVYALAGLLGIAFIHQSYRQENLEVSLNKEDGEYT